MSACGGHRRRSDLLVVLPDAVVAVETDTFEVGVHDEVDDARDRVRTVHRRCAARQDFGAADERRRDDVKVGRLVRAVRIARHEAAAVDQNQRALRTEVAKVDFRGTRCAVRNARRLGGTDGRQLVEDVFDPGRTGKLHVLVVDDRDRRGEFKVRLRNARAGDDDVTARRDVLTLGRNRRRRLGFDRTRSAGKRQDPRSVCPVPMPAWPARTHRPSRSLRADFDGSSSSFWSPYSARNRAHASAHYWAHVASSLSENRNRTRQAAASAPLFPISVAPKQHPGLRPSCA